MIPPVDYIAEAPLLERIVVERVVEPSRDEPRVDPIERLDWQALAWCESTDRPHVVDPTGTYGGLYQFDVPTWQSVGGTGLPQDASRAEQTRRAIKLYHVRGAQPWPVCGAEL